MQEQQASKILPIIDITLMNCMQKAVLSVVAELCEREGQRLDRELMCMIADSTLPRMWGNPEQFQ